jgi:hypothetical protein
MNWLRVTKPDGYFDYIPVDQITTIETRMYEDLATREKRELTRIISYRGDIETLCIESPESILKSLGHLVLEWGEA